MLDPEAKEFEIAYKGQEVAVDYVTMELTNQRQKVSLSLLKKDAETRKPLEGVVFGLYAQEDIKNAVGEVVVEKDALIELGTTDEEGKLVFQADLPHGKYYIQEVEHKPGYLPMMRCIPLMRLIQIRPLNCSLFQKKFLISLPLRSLRK